MGIGNLALKEIRFRKVSFAVALVSVAAAVGTFSGAMAFLAVHDLRTAQILERKRSAMEEQLAVLQDDMRKAMLKLGFNVVILPRDQDLGDWHADDSGYISGYSSDVSAAA